MIFRYYVGRQSYIRGTISALGGSGYLSISGAFNKAAVTSVQLSYTFTG